MRPSSPWLPEPLRLGKAQNAGATKSALLWRTWKTGTPRNAGHGPYRAAGRLSSVDGESTDTREQGQTQCGRNTVSAPHTQRYLLAAPRPPRSRTELANLNKRSPPTACVRAEIRYQRDRKQKPNKQREPLQKGPVQQIKIPVGNTDYTGRDL